MRLHTRRVVLATILTRSIGLFLVSVGAVMYVAVAPINRPAGAEEFILGPGNPTAESLEESGLKHIEHSVWNRPNPHGHEY